MNERKILKLKEINKTIDDILCKLETKIFVEELPVIEYELKQAKSSGIVVKIPN